MPDGRDRYTAYQGVLFIENADSGQAKCGVNSRLRVHSLIFPLATDIFARLSPRVVGSRHIPESGNEVLRLMCFVVPGAGLEPARPFGQTLLRRRCLPV